LTGDIEDIFVFLSWALSFECLNIATLFLVLSYFFRISRSPSGFNVNMKVMVTKSVRAQVCAFLGRILI